MRVLLINSVCGIKSTGRIVADIAEKYIKEGHICKIAYGREEAPEKYQEIAYRIGNNLDIYFNVAKARLFDNDGFNAKKQTKKFLEWAEKFNPDLIWLHNLHGYYLNVELLFEWIKSRPWMKIKWTLHDCWAFTGHCAHFSYVKCEKWKVSCGRCLQRKQYPSSLFIDNSRKNYEIKKRILTGIKNMEIITPSIWLKKLVEESYLKDYEIKVIHNTIDIDKFKPTIGCFSKKYNTQGKKIILGVASTWTVRKGLKDFFELANLLDESYQIVLVGLSRKQLRKLPEKIIGIERTNSKEELADLYTSARIFLNLSYEETYPTVNLEAQACGTTCIAYDTGGNRETVSKGYIVPQGDLKKVVDKIKWIANR